MVVKQTFRMQRNSTFKLTWMQRWPQGWLSPWVFRDWGLGPGCPSPQTGKLCQSCLPDLKGKKSKILIIVTSLAQPLVFVPHCDVSKLQQRNNHNLPNFNETSFEFLQEQIHFESKYSLSRSCCAMPGSYRPTQSLHVLIEPNHCQIMILNIWCSNWSRQHFFVILHQLLTIQILKTSNCMYPFTLVCIM